MVNLLPSLYVLYTPPLINVSLFLYLHLCTTVDQVIALFILINYCWSSYFSLSICVHAPLLVELLLFLYIFLYEALLFKLLVSLNVLYQLPLVDLSPFSKFIFMHCRQSSSFSLYIFYISLLIIA